MDTLSAVAKTRLKPPAARRGKRFLARVKALSLSLSVLVLPGWAAAQDASPAAPATPVAPAAPAAPAAGGTNGGQVTATTLAPVAVTAAAPDAAIRQQRRLTPGEVNIVSGNTFHQRPVHNTSDALRYVPGVMATSTTGGGDERISIRGSNLTNLAYDNSGFMLYQNGLPVSSADGANHNRLVNPYTASDMIVANGPNALTYGASALGGAIDFISRTARNSDPRQVYLHGGAYGLYSGYASTGGILGDFDGIVTAQGQHFAGYRHHSRENRHSVYGNVGWRVTDAFKLRLYGTHINSHQQLAGFLTRGEYHDNRLKADPSYVRGDHQLDVDTVRVALKGNWDVTGDSRLEFGVSHEHQSLYHPIVTSPFFSLLIDTHQDTTAAVARYHFKIGHHKLLAGVNLAHTIDQGGNYENDGGHKGARTDDVKQRSNNATLFVLDRWRFAPRWTLVYGGQGVITSRNVYDRAIGDGVRHQKNTYTSFNPRVGLIFALTDDSQAYGSVSRVYGAPDNFQLDNMRASALAKNATLKAMDGWEYEIGTRGRGDLPAARGTWHWSLDGYYARLHHEILAFGNPGNPDSANFDRTTHAGIEGLLSARYKVAGSGEHLIEPKISATYNDFKFDDDATYGNNRLPSAPDYQIHGQVMYRNAPTGLYAGPTFDFVGARYADMANDYRVGGYGLVGLRAGIQRERWEAFVQVSNLADRKYVGKVAAQTRAGPDSRVLNPGAPRTVFAGLRIHY
jgi:iron complex outermembrane receptor protein